MSHSRPNRRERLARRLSRFSAPLASRPLLLVLLMVVAAGSGCWRDSDSRLENLSAIARWEDRRLAPQDSLSALLSSQDAHVRLAAVRAAGLIGRDDVLADMLALLHDPSNTVRSQAAFSLGLLGDYGAVPALEAAAADPHQSVRLAALSGLAHISNEGMALLAAATGEDPGEAAMAWNGLRNRSGDIERQRLVEAISAGLTRVEPEVLWRVLRCAQLIPDPTLIPLLTPHARGKHPQVRVQAYRALAAVDHHESLLAILAGFASHDQFRERDLSRVEIGGCRALGNLAVHLLDEAGDGAADVASAGYDSDMIAALLIAAAGREDPHVAATALGAMEQAVGDLPVPAEAAERESLLPVWRIRLARAARSHIASEHVAVRAAAMRAWAALRGSGAAGPLVQAVSAEEVPQALAAGLHALSRIHPDALLHVARYAAADFQEGFNRPVRQAVRNAMVRGAALEGMVHIWVERRSTVPEGVPEDLVAHRLILATTDNDFVVATTAAGLLGGFPGEPACGALVDLWDRADGPYRSDLRRGALAGLQAVFTPADSAAIEPGWVPTESLNTVAARVLSESFDSADIRIRREGRQAALATGLLPARLIPTEASLLATLPAHRRDPGQPAVRLPWSAPEVLCRTDRGSFVIRLDGDIAPNTCASFVHLIERGFYNDLTFHRVVPDFVVQGGDPRGDGSGGPGYSIRSEWSPIPYRRTIVGIAHDGKDTGGSQFFVTLSAQPHLNGRYTVFGAVVDGMEIVDAIEVGDQFSLELMP